MNEVSLGAVVADHVRLPEQMTIDVPFIDIGVAQRRDPVDQHPVRGGVDHAAHEAAAMVIGGRDPIHTRRSEELGPLPEVAIVDTAHVFGLRAGDQLMDVLRHRQYPIALR
jgi:hypothetical protein